METVRWNLQACLLLFILQVVIAQDSSCHEQQGDCCKQCKPGHYLSRECGKCTPCPLKSYMDLPNRMPSCKQCERCEGIFRYKKTCTSTSNAVCECIPGKRCANVKCTRCENNPCPAGQQLHAGKCTACPLGTFNPGTEGLCRPWRDCSALGNAVLVNGTVISDVVCGNLITRATERAATSSTLTSTAHIPEEKLAPSLGITVIIIIIVVSFLIVLCLILFGFFFYEKLLEKMKNNFMKIPHPIVKQTEEEDACSCHYPEEEHGEDEPMTPEP